MSEVDRYVVGRLLEYDKEIKPHKLQNTVWNSIGLIMFIGDQVQGARERLHLELQSYLDGAGVIAWQ